ncbi:hypothetical protein FANTH_13416 [Fusarium anthophilum]|uniref:BHLH domain-containing protein n=1 Tax=Fusarium anthophilum TaxID=48485 RepID=A0A8H4YNV2_9HYPO|nr:hypothetical protein FANTH_13416 [Fusarium anthophilum]
MAALEFSCPLSTIPQSLDYPQLQMHLDLALKQSITQNLPWDLDQYLASEYISNASSSAGPSDYVETGYPLDYVPSPNAAPNHETNIGSPRNRTREFKATVEQNNQLSAETDLPDNASHIPDMQLQAASRRAKSRRQPITLNTPVHVRECHNHVEKQYRARLKLQFERLLAVLPASKTRSPADRDTISNSGQVLSRGQVLDLARERILQLEEELAMKISTMPTGDSFV